MSLPPVLIFFEVKLILCFGLLSYIFCIMVHIFSIYSFSIPHSCIIYFDGEIVFILSFNYDISILSNKKYLGFAKFHYGLYYIHYKRQD